MTSSTSTSTSIPIKTLYAYDGSGSTGGSRLYHETSQSIFRTLPTDGSTRILFWDSAACVISPDELRTINQTLKGNAGTDPSFVARHIVSTNFHGNLVFLSDGQVSSSSVDACDRCLPPGWTFESVRVILVDTGGAVNMSVSCPFTRNSPHTVQMVTVRNPTPSTVTQVTPDVIALLADLDAIKTVADWMIAAPLLEPAVIARTMGTTGDPSLRDRLLALKKRIQRAEADAKGGSSTTVALYDALASGNTNAALTLAATLTREYYGQEDDADIRSWSGQINRLVSMCEGALRGTFDLSNVNGAIQSDRARRAPMATPVEATAAGASEPDLSLDATGTATTSFVCPITLDATGDSDVALLITDGEPLLAGIDKDIVNSLANCPLYIFRYPELLARFQARLDHPLSLRALKEAEAVGASITESPMTRNPVLGAICLGPHDDHGAATNWTLARLTAGGKCLGNPDLWFAVIWLLVNRGAVPYLSPILPQLTTHLTWRLHAHKAPLSLLGTPEFPTTRVPLSVAIWYAISSSAMSSQPPPARETVRAHLPYLEELLELLRQTGFPMPSYQTTRHLNRLRVAMASLAWSKRDEVGLRGSLRALTQRALLVDKTWISLDGPAPADQAERVLASLPPIFHQLTEPELIGIGRMVDPSKSAADVALPFNWVPSEVPEAESTWTYGLAPIPRFPIPVCSATCRPYFKVPPTKDHTWEDAARFIFHMEPNQFLPVHAEFGHYVVKHGAFPTASQMLLHLWRRVTAQGRTTLPAQVEGFVEDILRDFAEVMTTLTPADVAARFQASVKRVDREHMEAASS